MSSETINKLKKLLETGKDWGELKTPVPGVVVVKLPGRRGGPGRLAIALNPLDPETKKPLKRKSLYLLSHSDYEAFLSLFENPKTETLFSIIDQINTEVAEKAKEEEDEEILEL